MGTWEARLPMEWVLGGLGLGSGPPWVGCLHPNAKLAMFPLRCYWCDSIFAATQDHRAAPTLKSPEHFSRMEDGDKSPLRKQQSRLVCVCSCGPGGQTRTPGYFLDSRLRGKDTKSVSSLPGREELLHSAKMLQIPHQKRV